MSKKYLVIALVGTELKMLSMLSNASRQAELEETALGMMRRLFKGADIEDLAVEPWPQVDLLSAVSCRPAANF